ncbi:MAG: hypothetical protein V3U92_19660 [Cellulophaga sp.]
MKGVFTFVAGFLMLIIVGLFLFFILNPLGLSITTAFANSGDDIMNSIEITIQNESLNASYHAILNDAQTSAVNSASIMRYLIKYSWLIMIIAVTMFFFLLARMYSESGVGSGVRGGLV